MPGRFAFLPNLRNSAAASAAGTGGARLRISYDVSIEGDGSAQGDRIPVGADLRGPGDVIGIASEQIARFEPAKGQRGFEPNYFPFIEFVDADFPWRYSLGTGTSKKLKPWLVLIALKPDEFELMDQGHGPLPRLRVYSANASLPNLSQAWACAHVQVNLDDGGKQSPEQAIVDNPANSFARIFCCRKLEPRENYHLFLVPSYEAGRLAGLDQDVEETDGHSWDNTSVDAIELPYYATSSLITDSQQDLELLARKLRAFKADEGDEAGSPRRASAEHPGYYEGYKKRGASFEIQTALNQTEHEKEPYNTDIALARKMKVTLGEVIKGEADDSDEDPLVAFPAYGHRFRQETGVDINKAKDPKKNGWFDRTNLDLKMRQAAAQGAETIRENQEYFAKLAWDQYEDVLSANQKLARLRIAEKLADRFAVRHFSKIPSDVMTVLSEPMQPYVSTHQIRGVSVIADQLQKAGSPAAYASRGLRRLACKRPVKKTSKGKLVSIKVPAPKIQGDISSSAAVSSNRSKALGLKANPYVSNRRAKGRLKTVMSSAFGTSAASAPQPLKLVPNVAKLDSNKFSKAIQETMVALPKLKADFLVQGRNAQEQKTLDPVWRSPEIPLPLSDYLSRMSRDTILSGVGDLPDNTVSVYKENRHFVEAFLIGANHAMNDELRWREFPTDMRGTIFSRFWNRAVALGSGDGADITPHHGWNRALGKNKNPSNPDGKENLVVVIKGDIVRKLGDPILVLNQSTGTKWKKGQGVDHTPAFFGKLGRETIYIGFDVSLDELDPEKTFFLIYEPMGRLRFGVDVANQTVRDEREDYTSRALPFPIKQLGGDYKKIPAPKPKKKKSAPPPLNQLSDWDDLSWTALKSRIDDAGYVKFNSIISTTNGADLWGSGRTSASLARAFWQKPIAAVLPFKRVI